MTWSKKLWWGVLLPVLICLPFLIVIAAWLPTGRDPEGSCALSVFFALPVLILGLVMVNSLLVYSIQWRRVSTLFFSGMVLPVLIILATFLYCHVSR